MNINYDELSIKEFLDLLYSKSPSPGGGGVASLCAAMACGLCGMVANLTYGKKKYKVYENDLQQILDKSYKLMNKCVEFITQDAKNFMPLAEAYGLPAQNEEQKKYKNDVIQSALKLAVSTPVDCIKTSCEIITMLYELTKKGSILTISDVGVGTACAQAAIKSAWVTVLINLNLMDDYDYVAKLRTEMQSIIDKTDADCAKIYNIIEERM